jgi:hypothetical protein
MKPFGRRSRPKMCNPSGDGFNISARVNRARKDFSEVGIACRGCLIIEHLPFASLQMMCLRVAAMKPISPVQKTDATARLAAPALSSTTISKCWLKPLRLQRRPFSSPHQRFPAIDHGIFPTRRGGVNSFLNNLYYRTTVSVQPSYADRA